MSSILDALRKSAQSREQHGRDWTPVPGSRRIFSAPRHSRFPGRSVLIGALLAAGFGLWFLGSGSQPQQPAVSPILVVPIQEEEEPAALKASDRPPPTERMVPQRPAPSTAVIANPTQAPRRTAGKNPQGEDALTRSTLKSFVTPTRRPMESDIVSIYELPEALRNKVEGLTLNVHVYADDPEKRLSLIDMHRVRSGDPVAPGVRVQAIVPRGVVLLVQGHRVLLETRH